MVQHGFMWCMCIGVSVFELQQNCCCCCVLSLSFFHSIPSASSSSLFNTLPLVSYIQLVYDLTIRSVYLDQNCYSKFGYSFVVRLIECHSYSPKSTNTQSIICAENMLPMETIHSSGYPYIPI